MKEFIFRKILGLLPAALLKQLLNRYFSRNLIVDFRKSIFTKRLSVAASKIHKFPTSFIKSVLAMYVEIDVCFSTIKGAGRRSSFRGKGSCYRHCTIYL